MEDSCLVKPKIFIVCEFIGSMFLVIAAVVPMILFIEVLKTDIAIAVVADALAVGFVLFALIEMFGPICTAYFNPVVSIGLAISKDITWSQAFRYSFTQILGGLFGIILSHLMFYDRVQILLTISDVQRSGGAYIGEILGTFILVLCIFSLVHQKSNRVSLFVGLLVGGMLLCTSSTMFANPQVTVARMFTYSVAGVNIFDGVVFIVMQSIGAISVVYIWKYYISKCALNI